MTPADLPANMTSKITEDEHGCWIWKGARAKNGYGSVGYKGKVWSAHRLAYTLLIGPVPDGLVLDHAVCGVKACCRPDHLEPVTNQENIRRDRARITHCPAGHEYTPDNIVWNHGTRRNCRKCHGERARAWSKANYAKKKAERLAALAVTA